MNAQRKAGAQAQAHRRTKQASRKRSDPKATKTEQTPVQVALQKQLHFLQTLIDTIPNPIFYKDCNNLYLGCNRAFENRLGLSKDEIVGKSAYDIFPPDLARKYHKMDLALLQQPGEQSYEDTLLYADGSLRDVIVKKATFDTVDGNLAGLVGVTVDITERKRAEAALQRANDELEVRVRKRTAQLAKANEGLRNEIAERLKVEEALQESSERLKFFAYTVMHDLKSPTVGINGLTRLLERQYTEILDERGNRYCNQILKASEHLVALVEKINVYIAAKEVPLKIEEIDIQEILDEIKAEFTTVLSSRRVAWIEPDDMPRIKGDRLSMVRVFRNLVDNALKYGGEGLSEVRIGYEERDDCHTFSVSDNGVGLKGNYEKIFGAFQRNETAKGIEGAGLGLSIIREIAESHNGSVWVEPGPAGGATFFFSIGKKTHLR